MTPPLPQRGCAGLPASGSTVLRTWSRIRAWPAAPSRSSGCAPRRSGLMRAAPNH